jgi:hypothetical protein
LLSIHIYWITNLEEQDLNASSIQVFIYQFKYLSPG